MRGEPRIPAAWPRVLAARSDAGARRTALEVLADQELERAEVALGQVLEAPPACGKGGFGGVESRNGSQEVLVVLGELQLHGAAQRRVAGQSQRGLAPIAAALDKRAEAEALEPLRHRAPVPPQRPRRRLHVEPVLAKAGGARDPSGGSRGPPGTSPPRFRARGPGCWRRRPERPPRWNVSPRPGKRSCLEARGEACSGARPAARRLRQGRSSRDRPARSTLCAPRRRP